MPSSATTVVISKFTVPSAKARNLSLASRAVTAKDAVVADVVAYRQAVVNRLLKSWSQLEIVRNFQPQIDDTMSVTE